MLDPNKLGIFLRVAEEGSFSRAAAQLHMSQPAVSQHILALEQQLGATLFDRSRQGVGLTAAGRTLQGYAEEIVRLIAEAELAVTDLRRVAAGQIVAGATPGVSAYLLPDWIESYRARYPNVAVAIQTGVTSVIVRGVLERELALGVIEGELDAVEDRRLGAIELESIEQLVIVGQGHPWWGAAHVPIGALAGQPLVMRQPGSQSRIWLDEQLRAAGVQPRIIAELDNIESIKRMVLRGGCCAVLPAYAARDELAGGQLQAIPVSGASLRRTLKLIWNRAVPRTPVVRSAIEHLSRVYPAAIAAPGAPR